MAARSSIDRAAVVAEARSWIGTPYLHQASLKGAGCDCLGLVRGVWRGIFGEEPELPAPYSPDWAEAHGRETLAEAAGRHMVPVALNAIEPGDVLLFAMKDHAPAKHCAIMSAPGQMIHAIEAHPVAEVTLWSSERAGRRLRFAFAFPGLIG
ncbi:MAG: C40 family peptidase [Rhizobiales bacterium]|nr:C40 family peptidase [Hyphomicrobiales bacterium]MBI3672550.1 C40 family peptidase [Hyphomicrobiales bacterium]